MKTCSCARSSAIYICFFMYQIKKLIDESKPLDKVRNVIVQNVTKTCNFKSLVD